MTDPLSSPLLSLSQTETLLDGLLDFYPQAIRHNQALLAQLRQTLPWSQDSVFLYGRTHRIPRLQCWIADPGVEYSYSGKQLINHPWPETLNRLRDELNKAFGLQLNSVLCNLYRDGQDSMGWHSDDEPELGPDPGIISVTLGAERDFSLRLKGTTRQNSKLALPDGSLLYMKPGMQRRWEHAVPKRAGVSSARINLTFREIIH